MCERQFCRAGVVKRPEKALFIFVTADMPRGSLTLSPGA